MVKINIITPLDKFVEDVKKIKDKGLKRKLEKQIMKIKSNAFISENLHTTRFRKGEL